jgi:hypothetical protein
MSVVDTNIVREIPNTVAYPMKASRTQLSHVLALYKLIDVLHALAGKSEGRNPTYSRSSVIGITSDDTVRFLFFVFSLFSKAQNCKELGHARLGPHPDHRKYILLIPSFFIFTAIVRVNAHQPSDKALPGPP